jgi:hypothetical protein
MDESLLTQIAEIEKSLLEPAKNFNLKDHRNEITKMDLEHERICAHLESNGIANPKTLTVFEFQAKLDFFEKKQEPTEKKDFS